MNEILYTIGFTGKGAEEFFSLLARHEVRTILDIRLHNTSQLAGFTKRDDLRYFLRVINKADYRHVLSLGPTEELFARLKRRPLDWDTFRRDYLALLGARKVEEELSPDLMDHACLLCSEASPHTLPSPSRRRIFTGTMGEHHD